MRRRARHRRGPRRRGMALIDVIVGGHSHTRLDDPVLVGDILVVQAGSHLKNLGRLDLRVEDDHAVITGEHLPNSVTLQGATEICSEISAPGMMISANDTL